MSIGPVQMLILGFEDPKFTGENLAELERLREADIVRVVDMLAVWKDAEGNVAVLQDSQLSEGEAAEFGAVVGGLIGLGMAGEDGLEAGAEAGVEAMEDGHLLDADDAWVAVDAIPNNTAAVVVLLEHRWAIPLRDAIAGAGGVALADAWLAPEDVASLGLHA
jgi:uncharacterized membrane protein